MDWGRVRFFFSEVARNFSRTAVLQFTAVATVAIMILILGSFLFTRELVQGIGNDIIRKIEISVYLSDGLDEKATRALRVKIASDPRVRSVLYVPKAEGLKQMQRRLRGQVDTSLLTANPLPDAMRVKVVAPETVRAVAESIRAMPGVGEVVYAQDAVAKMLRFSDTMARVGLAVVCLLLATAAIIISNTIRLTVFARRREIAIMQLVGASSAYVRGPFIFEGFVDGLLGAALAIGLLAIARQQLLPKLMTALPFLPIASATPHVTTLVLELLATGALVGILASWFSVGRHLRA
jgi:cell division transport system permease protein